ncbi:MAG TPA: hypothetical protein VFB42_09805 [Gaiellaceae bacterium]|nr:hypothetical protein [Gaiellaceae bacterium]
MTRLGFLSPWNAAPGVALASPLAHAQGPGIDDVSQLGKLELRGALDRFAPAPGEELVRTAPARALLVTEGSPAAALERARAAGLRAYDLTAALAAFELEGEDALRRLTDADPASLPAACAVARGVRAVVQPRGGGRYRIFVPQELGLYAAEVALDVLRGLGR